MTDYASLGIKVDSKGVVSATKNLNKLERQGKTTESSVKRIGAAFAALGAGAVARGILQTNIEFETLRTSLVTTTGSMEDASAAFQKIKDFASETPFAVSELTSAFIKLSNLGLDPSNEALTSLGNTAGAMGKSLNQAVEAVADAVTGEFERLKEFGIKSKSEGDKVTFTFRGVATEVGKNSAEIQKYLLDIGNVQFAGGMERQAATLSGAISNLGDSWANFSDSIVNEEASTSLQGSIRGITSGINGLTNNLETLATVGTGVAVVIGARLAGSAVTATGSMIAAQVQAIRYQASLASMAGVSRVAATSQLAMAASIRVASGAMSLLGGPAGVVLLAAAGLYAYATSADTATESTGLLSKSLDNLTVAQARKRLLNLGEGYEEAKDKALDLAEKIHLLKDQLADTSKVQDSTGLSNELITLEGDFDDATEVMREFISVREQLNDIINKPASSPEAIKAPVIASKADKDSAADDKKVIDNLIRRGELLGLNAEATDLYNAKKDLSNKADSVTLAIASDEISMYHSRLAAIESENQAVTDKLELQSRLVANSSAFAQSIKTPTQLFNDQISTLKMWRDTVDETTGEALISQQQYATGVSLATLELEALNEKTEESTSLFGDMQEASENWSRSFADSLVEGTGNFEDFASSMLKELQKVALAKAFNPIFGEVGGFVETALSSILPSFAGGGSTGNGPRSGGVDGMGGYPAIVHPQEHITDLSRGQKVGGGSTSIVVNVDASGSKVSGDNDGKQLGNMIGIAVRAVLIDESRPGGMLA